MAAEVEARRSTTLAAQPRHFERSAASQFAELRVGHLDANGNFVNPTIPINDGANTITGRSIVNDRAVIPQAQEHIPAAEDIRALRAALNTLGDGFVEAIDDATLQAIAANQPGVSDGRIHGEAILVPVLEAPGQTRVGRFGWKDQHMSASVTMAGARTARLLSCVSAVSSKLNSARRQAPSSARSATSLRFFAPAHLFVIPTLRMRSFAA